MENMEIAPSSSLMSAQTISQIQLDHGEATFGTEESARIWRHPALRGVELFQGIYRNYKFVRHFHAVPAIGIVDGGSMRVHDTASSHVLPSGTIFLLNPGDVHAPGPASEGGWSFRVFYLEESLLDAHSIELSEKIFRFSKQFVQDQLLANKMLRLHRKLEADGTTLEMESSLLSLLKRLAEYHVYQPGQLKISEIDTGKVKRVLEYLRANYHHNINLADLSAIAQSSPFQVLRTFRSAIGLTPHAYLIQIRIESAKRLLRSGHTISDVAVHTGFTDQSHFTRHFKRITGVTPGRYLPRDTQDWMLESGRELER
ncbi:MAG TPA: AraC family transcriptional regulator [Acidobacteriaceae bacterium]|nr:AraC family transcriptional regulator [Acidobacteriaceae bacterium]